MNRKSFRLKAFAFLMTFLLSFSQFAAAWTPQKNLFLRQEDEVKKLPPVNWIRSRAIDVKHVSIDLRFDWEKESAYGTTTITIAPFKDTDKFYLDAAMMTINSVKLQDGTNLKFNYDGKKENDNLEILAGRTLKSGEDITVKVDYRTNYVNSADADTAIGSFGRGIRFIKPNADEPDKPMQIWSQGETEFNRYWFPSYDTPNDFRTSELRATVDKKYFVVSNGKLMENKDNGDGTRTFYWKMDQPYSNYLTSIVVGEYAEVKNGEYDGKPIYAYGYPSETKEVAATTKNLPATIKFFSEKTGVKYPYAKYSQTFVEDFGGGMENISATTQIEEMIHDERELLETDSESLQSHELAHQWFGDYVTCRDWGQIWLNESFATYFQSMWDEEFKGHEEFLYTDVRNNQQQTIDTWMQGNRRPIVTKYYANKDAMFDTYAYPGGGSVLHMLRKHLGEENWWKAINHYLVSNAHQPVSTEDLRIAIEESTGESMDWFFDQWLYKMGHPVFEITQSYDDAKKQVSVNVKQTQKVDPKNEFPQVEFYQSKVDIEVDGTVHQVWIEPKAENVFTFDSASKPKLVNFDYEGTLLKELKFEKSVDDLIYQMANDKDVIGKRWAMAELVKKAANPADKSKIIAALLNTAEKDSFWHLRSAAISEIGEMSAPQGLPGTEPQAAQIDAATAQVAQKLAKDAQAQVRISAISVLGATRDAKYADLYLAALNDRSYGVIDAAAIALGTTKSPKAYDALVKLVSTPSWKGRIQIAGLNGLAALGDKRALDVGLKSYADKKLPSNARTAALTVIGSAGKGDSRAYPLIFESFKKSLAGNDFQGIFNGVQAIVKLADPRGQEAFDLLKEKFKNQANILGFVTFFEAQFKEAIKPQENINK
ncbi:MAG: M1 family aminopeptidase [Pyrinomonadaceae bacterium]